MSGYREITVPGETGRARRPAVRRQAVQGDWRSVLVGALKATGHSCRNSPGTVLGSLAGLGAAAFICVNALGYQAHRHPAPILPKLAQKAPPAREAAPPPERPPGSRSARSRGIRSAPKPRRPPPSRQPGTRSAS